MRRNFWPMLVSLLFAIYAQPTGVAFAGDCDGTPADDTVVCSSDPVTPDTEVGLDFGDDVYLQDEGVTSVSVGGDAEPDGSQNAGDGGDDHITINGTVILCVDGDYVDGNGGNDTIIINGEVQCEVTGDYATGNGGDDKITVNGIVDSNVIGDNGNGDGGNDTIIINGYVGGDVYGDFVDVNGGDDFIVINGTVSGDVLGDDAFGVGGNDTITLGVAASVGGIIDGEDGFDTLVFAAFTQSQLAGLDPAGGSISFGGHTYTWQNFEQLIGLLREAFRVLFDGGQVIALGADNGIAVFAEHGRIAYIDFGVLAGMDTDAVMTFSTPNGAGWYVTVTDLGANGNSGNTLFQVNIYNAAGNLVGQFTFAN
jgi:hypothetical protein